jgi:hypothetical protein
MIRSLASRGLLPLATLACLAAVGRSQAFNVELGSYNPEPSSSYGAGANQPGFWNHVVDNKKLFLNAIDGSPSSVTFKAYGGGGSFGYNHPGTSGDDELLLDGGHDGENTLVFEGLQPGKYLVYTYAWAPDNPSGYQTVVEVVPSLDPKQTVGKSWPGAHAQGATYAKHSVNLTSGKITIDCTAATFVATQNGVQIVPEGGCSGNLTFYCTSKQNSAGCSPFVTTLGTPSASASSGFVIKTVAELPNKLGKHYYSLSGANNAPFQGGFLCLQPPLVRTPVQSSGGSIACTGAYSLDFNAYIASGKDPALVAGQQVWVQTWARDPASPSTTSLSNALTFTICP